ncbi:hypothetical protein GCM10022393_21700 [Aquimarina addita]|uniref:DUF4468 domain-containing protein n=1 Tax=Aquimarina addita TaxID=870485 RepID=A0ABP6UIP0_9FLAO
MKSACLVLTLFFSAISFGQTGVSEAVNSFYEDLISNIINKDTVVKQMTKYYKCSETLSGTVDFFYKESTLKLIRHTYKQGVYGDLERELYYMDEEGIRMYITFSEITDFKSFSFEDDQEQIATTKKILEVTESRIFFEKKAIVNCYERKHSEDATDWNQKYFDTLKFVNKECDEDLADIYNKYRILCKAEKNLRNAHGKKPCIFHIW